MICRKATARDDTPGHTGDENVHTPCRFSVSKPVAGAKDTFQAEIKGDGGTDSYGDLFVVWDWPVRFCG
jgi:hypothetical protein